MVVSGYQTWVACQPMKAGMLCLSLAVTPALAQVPASHSVGKLSRLIYDARAAGMGGAAIAIKNMPSAPVENAATLAYQSKSEVTLSIFGHSDVGGGIETAKFFIAGTPDRVDEKANFNRMIGYGTPAGRNAAGELTIFGSVRYKNFALFGTKGAIADTNIVSSEIGNIKSLEVTGEGTEYETIGLAYGFKLNPRTAVGISIKEARFYRATIDFSGTSINNGDPIVVDNSDIVRGLELAVDVSVFHQTTENSAIGAVIRNVNSPEFDSTLTDVQWRTSPSLDIGIAWQSPDGNDLLALDVRDVFQNFDSGRSVIKAGWEHRFGSKSPWFARFGITDSDATFGFGWKSKCGSFDVAFGEDPSQKMVMSARFKF